MNSLGCGSSDSVWLASGAPKADRDLNITSGRRWKPPLWQGLVDARR